MITREQVADLRPGDVVELRDDRYPDVLTTGPLTADTGGALLLGNWRLLGAPANPDGWSLTVVSLAPRPLYVNHSRTEPVPGDVVRDAYSNGDGDTWSWAIGSAGNGGWLMGGSWNAWSSLNGVRLCLLVDGETGQVVP